MYAPSKSRFGGIPTKNPRCDFSIGGIHVWHAGLAIQSRFSFSVIVRCFNGIRREKLIHRETDFGEERARVIFSRSNTLFLRQTVIICRHEELRVTLQPYNGKLPQCDIYTTAIAAHHELTAKSCANAARDLSEFTIRAMMIADIYNLHTQDNRIHRFNYCPLIGKRSTSISRFFGSENQRL